MQPPTAILTFPFRTSPLLSLLILLALELCRLWWQVGWGCCECTQKINTAHFISFGYLQLLQQLYWGILSVGRSSQTTRTRVEIHQGSRSVEAGPVDAVENGGISNQLFHSFSRWCPPSPDQSQPVIWRRSHIYIVCITKHILVGCRAQLKNALPQQQMLLWQGPVPWSLPLVPHHSHRLCGGVDCALGDLVKEVY